MDILLCLLSEQHVPNLLSVHHFRPDRIALIESERMGQAGASRHFLTALQQGGLDYRDRCDIEPLDQEDSLTAVQHALQRVYGMYPTANWLVNVTGGTKPMSIATCEFFRVLGAKLLYVSNRAPDSIIELEQNQTQKCTYKPTIREFLSGYGFGWLKKQSKIDAAEERARAWWDCSRVIAMTAGPTDLLALSEKERHKARDKGLEVGSTHCTDLLRQPTIRDAIAKDLGLQIVGDDMQGKLDKYAVSFLTGEWLEVFIWGLLNKHKAELDVWDVHLGIVVGKDGGSLQNELDVTFMHRFNMNMIECKSGDQSYDPGADILYKIEAVMHQFGAIRVRKYLATTAANVLQRDSSDIRPAIKTRADIYNCNILPSAAIRQLAAAADSPETVKSILRLQ